MVDIEEISDFLKALSDPTRLRIVFLLNQRKKPYCVGAISRKLNITPSAVSQHLRILRQMRLVKPNRMGNHIHYELNKEEMVKFHTDFLNLIKNKK